MAGEPRSAATRFLAKVRKSEACWVWTGALLRNGYGYFGLGRRVDGVMLAHRFAYRTWCGPIPPGLDVCHRCDNPACVRPDHLFVGTRSDNMRDSVQKGRNRNAQKAACLRGHAYTRANTIRKANGGRQCRTCHKSAQSRYRGRVRSQFQSLVA